MEFRVLSNRAGEKISAVNNEYVVFDGSTIRGLLGYNQQEEFSGPSGQVVSCATAWKGRTLVGTGGGLWWKDEGASSWTHGVRFIEVVNLLKSYDEALLAVGAKFSNEHYYYVVTELEQLDELTSLPRATQQSIPPAKFASVLEIARWNDQLVLLQAGLGGQRIIAILDKGRRLNLVLKPSRHGNNPLQGALLRPTETAISLFTPRGKVLHQFFFGSDGKPEHRASCSSFMTDTKDFVRWRNLSIRLKDNATLDIFPEEEVFWNDSSESGLPTKLSCYRWRKDDKDNEALILQTATTVQVWEYSPDQDGGAQSNESNLEETKTETAGAEQQEQHSDSLETDQCQQSAAEEGAQAPHQSCDYPVDEDYYPAEEHYDQSCFYQSTEDPNYDHSVTVEEHYDQTCDYEVAEEPTHDHSVTAEENYSYQEQQDLSNEYTGEEHYDQSCDYEVAEEPSREHPVAVEEHYDYQEQQDPNYEHSVTVEEHYSYQEQQDPNHDYTAEGHYYQSYDYHYEQSYEEHDPSLHSACCPDEEQLDPNSQGSQQASTTEEELQGFSNSLEAAGDQSWQLSATDESELQQKTNHTYAAAPAEEVSQQTQRDSRQEEKQKDEGSSDANGSQAQDDDFDEPVGAWQQLLKKLRAKPNLRKVEVVKERKKNEPQMLASLSDVFDVFRLKAPTIDVEVPITDDKIAANESDLDW